MADTQYDVIVLGSGPGGYVAAIRCAQLGLKTAIVERELLGGICLNWGCIPTKALLRSAEIFHYMQHAGDYGLKVSGIEADLQAVVKRSRGVAKQLNAGVTHLMKKNKIAVHMGEGTLTGPTSLTVKSDKGEEKLTAKHVIVATGARARDLPFAKADGKRVWTYRHAMTPAEMPGKLLVIGSGAIGIEFASFYNDMGCEVTVVEMLDRVVPVEDADVSAFLEKSLTKQGMTIMTGAGVEALTVGTGGVKAKIKAKDGKTAESEFSHVIVAVGIVPNTESIGLEKLVDLDRGFIQIDPYGRTKAKGLWAIGDCTPGPWLAHKASHEGVTRRRGDRAGAGQQGGPPAPARPQQHPRLHLLPPADRIGRHDRGQGQGGGPQRQGRDLPLHRQRQGHRAGRGGGLHQDGVRRQDRRAARRPHDRRRGDRADPGLCRGQDARDHRGRADEQRVPAPDAERDDARKRAGGLWAGAAHLIAAERGKAE